MFSCWPTLDFGVFDEHIQSVSDGWAGGFRSCQIQIQHRRHQVVVNELCVWFMFFLNERKYKNLDAGEQNEA